MPEERSIYIGDLINIKISDDKISEAEIKDKFKDFEIVELKNTQYGYIITIRSFDIGEKIVQIGNKELKITIKTTLEEIKNENIFEGNLKPLEQSFNFDLQYVFYLFIIIFLLTGSIVLKRYLKKKQIKKLSHLELFIKEAKSITLNENEYFVKLTKCFKNYIEVMFSIIIKGKTSKEIIIELMRIERLKTVLPEIESWLEKVDRYKFAGIFAEDEAKEHLINKIISTAEKINEIKEVEEQ